MNDELKHYGVLGMKWGVRRARNNVQTSSSKKKTEDQELRDKNRQIKKERRSLNRNRRTLSTEELKAKIERLETEKKLRELTQQDVSKGRTMVEKILMDIGETTLRAVGTYAVKAILDGTFDRKEAASFIKPKK